METMREGYREETGPAEYYAPAAPSMSAGGPGVTEFYAPAAPFMSATARRQEGDVASGKAPVQMSENSV